MSDWSFEPTFQSTEPIPAGQLGVDQYQQDWPFNFKWGVNKDTGEATVWRVAGGTDGRPVHRAYLRDQWGRDSSAQQGDTLGLAQYKPAEKMLDGTVYRPAKVTIVTYYARQTPECVREWFRSHFPDAQIVDGELGAGRSIQSAAEFDPAALNNSGEANKLKWMWHPKDGALLWRADKNGLPSHNNQCEQVWGRKRDPLDRTGWVDEDDPSSLSIEQYFGLPPADAISSVKNELAQQYPDRQIKLPETQEDLGIEESFGHDGPRLGALWAATIGLGGHRKAQEATEAPQTYLAPHLAYVSLAGADMSGAMVAVYLPKKVGDKLVIDHEDAEPVDRMHITLAYFKDKAADRDDWHKVEEIVQRLAAKTKRLSGKIGGYGVFSNPDEGDVLWASPSVDGLAELRDDVVEEVEKAGFEISRDHGWTPHITLLYDFSGELPRLDKPIDVIFESLTFARGEAKQDSSFG